MSYRVLLLAARGCRVRVQRRARPAGPDSAVIAPDKVVDSDVLYGTNCAGCHGANGTGGLRSVSPILYLAIANDATIRRVTADGVPGTAMPAFAQSAGGL
jgi:mono/diheme cytochrome c family protein